MQFRIYLDTPGNNAFPHLENNEDVSGTDQVPYLNSAREMEYFPHTSLQAMLSS